MPLKLWTGAHSPLGIVHKVDPRRAAAPHFAGAQRGCCARLKSCCKPSLHCLGAPSSLNKCELPLAVLLCVETRQGLGPCHAQSKHERAQKKSSLSSLMNRPCVPARAMLQRQRSGKDGGYQPIRNTSPERLPRLGRHVSPGPELTKRPQTQSANRPLDRTQRVNQPTVNRTIAPGQARCPGHSNTLVCWRQCGATFVQWWCGCRHAVVRSCSPQDGLLPCSWGFV